jgi:circadian clock protein KaiC
MADTANLAAVAGRQATGIAGLDDVLGGGFPANRMYLVDGDPGTGKTTLALQFLIEGVAKGEPGLYVTLSETSEELRAVAASHGWSLDGVGIHELSDGDSLTEESHYTVFQPAEVELGDTMSAVFDTVDRTGPRRVAFDSLSEMRLLARDPLRYRRQILSLKQFFAGRRCTVLLLDDRTVETGDRQLHSLAHGVVRLEQLAREYGPARRRLQVIKLRGSAYREGLHDFVIRRGGLSVYPRLVAVDRDVMDTPETISSGIPGLDRLLGGGVKTGSTVLFMGPAGVGKSLVVANYVAAIAKRGKRVAIFAFDEDPQTLLAGTQGIGLSFAAAIEAGSITIRSPNPAELSPGEFVGYVRTAVEGEGARLVVIDSLNGYLSSMPEERLLDSHLHELFSYLRQHGVLTLTTMAQHGVLGSMQTMVDVSYLADTVVLLRYFEFRGAIRRAISVLKRRAGDHEKTIRELTISATGLHVGDPLDGLHGVLSGIPQIVGTEPAGGR